MYDVLAAIEGSHDVEMVCGLVIFRLGGDGGRCVGGAVARYLDVPVCSEGGGRQGTRKWKRVQAYDALLWLRHDADCNDRDETLMKTCKMMARGTRVL